MNTRIANLLLLLMGAIWGIGFAAQQLAMNDIGPFLFIGLRFLLAGTAVLPLAIIELKRRPASVTRPPLRQYLPLGFVFFAGLSVQQVGLLGTTISNAGFLTTLYVLLVPTLAKLFFGQQPSPLVWPAAGASLLGVFLLSSGNFGNLSWGDILMVGGAVFWALHVIVVGRVSRATSLPVTTACAQFLIAGLLGCGTALLTVQLGWNRFEISLDAIRRAAPEVLYAGLISGALAFTLQSIAQRYTSSSVAVVLMSTESLFAALTGAMFLGETLAPIAYLGGGLIVASVVLVQIASERRARFAEPSAAVPEHAGPEATNKNSPGS